MEVSCMEVSCCAARIDDARYVIAEDWGSHDSASEASFLAATILQPDSGYAGSKRLDKIADFIMGLLNIRSKSLGCSLFIVSVLDEPN